MPAVALFSKPNGAPMASTHCPTTSELEFPSVTVGRLSAGILITATSETLSTPMTLAVYSRRSVSCTVTRVAPSTTWALVRMRPSGWMMKPEPSPRMGCCSGGAWKGRPRKNGANGLLGPNGLLSPSSGAFSMTRMLTTAGPNFFTSVVKSGSITATPPRGWDDVTAAGGGDPCACAIAGAATEYRVASGAATSTAPITPATNGLRTTVLTLISHSADLSGVYGTEDRR